MVHGHGMAKKKEPDEYPEIIPVNARIPWDNHAKLTTAAKHHDRSVGAQIRIIVREWAERQDALPERRKP